MATKTESYAIIAVGGKQYVVREGERLVVDRLPHAENATFHPDVLLVGGDGKADLSPSVTVTARVVEHGRGPKIRIGKYKPKSGYRKHTGFRAAVSQILIESIGAEKAKPKRAAKPKAEEEPKAEAAVVEEAPAEKTKPRPRAAKPKAEAAEEKPKAAAKKPAAKRPTAKKTPKKDEE